jgi:hypothetical protein
VRVGGTEFRGVPLAFGSKSCPITGFIWLEDDHIASAPVKIARDDDLSAVRQSQKLLDRHDIQLWEGRRLVTRLKSKSVA